VLSKLQLSSDALYPNTEETVKFPTLILSCCFFSPDLVDSFTIGVRNSTTKHSSSSTSSTPSAAVDRIMSSLLYFGIDVCFVDLAAIIVPPATDAARDGPS